MNWIDVYTMVQGRQGTTHFEAVRTFPTGATLCLEDSLIIHGRRFDIEEIYRDDLEYFIWVRPHDGWWISYEDSVIEGWVSTISIDYRIDTFLQRQKRRDELCWQKCGF